MQLRPVHRPDYKIGVPRAGIYRELLNSDDTRFGGSGILNAPMHSHKKPMHGFEQSISVDLPPMSAVLLRVPAQRAKKAGDAKSAAKKAGAPKAAKTAKAEAKTAKAAKTAGKTAQKRAKKQP